MSRSREWGGGLFSCAPRRASGWRSLLLASRHLCPDGCPGLGLQPEPVHWGPVHPAGLPGWGLHVGLFPATCMLTAAGTWPPSCWSEHAGTCRRPCTLSAATSLSWRSASPRPVCPRFWPSSPCAVEPSPSQAALCRCTSSSLWAALSTSCWWPWPTTATWPSACCGATAAS